MSKDSKFLSLVLRHSPDVIDITLDDQGWTPIDTLLRQMKKAGRPMTRAELEQVVETNDKRRFTISENGRLIRAAQGHSIPVDLGLPDIAPPDHLYHGTAAASLDAIFDSGGLKPAGRRQVHLSPDRTTALKVGGRHGRPVVLRVATGQMHSEGYRFQRADNGVWLTDCVPRRFLSF